LTPKATEGNEIGEHEGHQHYTVGQRRGIGIPARYPLYVLNKNAQTNTITVGPREQLHSDGCLAAETNWLTEPSDDWLACTARIRYNAEPVPAWVRATDNDEIEVQFDEPQFAVAPGQAVVCYDNEHVICGGWITEALDAH